MGMPPTGRRIALDGMTIQRVGRQDRRGLDAARRDEPRSANRSFRARPGVAETRARGSAGGGAPFPHPEDGPPSQRMLRLP
jgi:hypothetical protein